MAISETTIINAAFALVGLKKAADTAEDRKGTRVYNLLYEQGRNEMFDLPHDWKFATTRAELSQLYLLTLDDAPTAAWAVADTITGATSAETCVIVSVVSTKIFIVTEPSGDFTDGEVLSNGTGTRDCATGYPVTAEEAPPFGYDHQYKLPTNFRRVVAQVDDDGDDTEYKYRRELLIDDAANEIDVFLTDEASVYIKYLRIRTDVSTWPSWFVKLVYLNLAILLCEPLKQKSTKQNQLLLMFEEAMKIAVMSNGLEDSNTDTRNVNTDKGNSDVLNAATHGIADKNYVVDRGD